jgi:hypothetical protein
MFRTTLMALSWLGRQGTRAVAALVFIGVAVPPIDALLRSARGRLFRKREA